jgi:hypothetical protein
MLACLHLKMKKYAKIPYLGVKYTQLRSSQKMEIFFYLLSPVLLTPLTNIHLGLSPRFFEKNRNDHSGMLRGQGDTDLRKKPEAKNLVSHSL